MTRCELHQIARRFLQNQLDLLSVGEPLPGVRTLCDKSQINFHILNVELQELIKIGQIKSVPRKGLYKSKDDSSKIIWLFHEQEIQTILKGFTYEVHEELRLLCEQSGYTLKHCLVTPSFIPKYKSFCQKHHVKIAFCKGFTHPWFTKLIASECKHCISLLPHYVVNEGFALIDSPQMSKVQLEHLLNLGYRKIGYIHNVDTQIEKTFVQQNRLSEFYKIMAEHGLIVKDKWVFSGYCTPRVFADRLNLLINSGAEAVIVPGTFVNLLYDTLKKQLFVPGKDLGVFCCDELTDFPDPIPATVTNSPKAIVRSAWQLLQESINGLPPRIEQSQLKIITGKTLFPKV